MLDLPPHLSIFPRVSGLGSLVFSLVLEGATSSRFLVRSFHLVEGLALIWTRLLNLLPLLSIFRRIFELGQIGRVC